MNVQKPSFKVALKLLSTEMIFNKDNKRRLRHTKRMLKTAGVEIIEYKPTGRTLHITV